MALRNVIGDFMEGKEETKEWIFLMRRIESIATHIMEVDITINQILLTGQTITSLNQAEAELNNMPSGQKSASSTPDPGKESKELSLTTRKAIQTLIASVIAIIVGQIIAPIQPYWVLLTVFICMLGTESIGRVNKKGFQRSAGTVIVAAIGFFLAHLLSGHLVIELIIVFLVVFVSGYTATLSYTLMSVFLTMTVAFMYDILLGGITFPIIWARITETVAGAVITYVVSITIFPKKTNAKVAEVSSDYLKELKPFLLSYIKQLRDSGNVKEFTEHAISIDTKLQMVESEAEPIMKGTEAHSHSKISEWVTIFTAMNYYARHLIIASYQEHITYLEGLMETLQYVEDKLEHNIDKLSQLIKGEIRDATVYSLMEERNQLENFALDRQLINDDVAHQVYYVWRINQCIVTLSKGFGAKEI